MSYDIWMVADLGGPEPVAIGDSVNHTYNCSAMFRLALGGKGVNDLERQTGRDMLPRLKSGIRHMEENPNLYLPLNPPNGWGSYDTALEYLKELEAMAEAAPKAMFRVG